MHKAIENDGALTCTCGIQFQIHVIYFLLSYRRMLAVNTISIVLLESFTTFLRITAAFTSI